MSDGAGEGESVKVNSDFREGRKRWQIDEGGWSPLPARIEAVLVSTDGLV